MIFLSPVSKILFLVVVNAFIPAIKEMSMDPQVMEKMRENLQASDLAPIFADEVVILRNLKTHKDEKGKLEKEGHVALVFVDMMNQRPIGKFILSLSTASQLQRILAHEVGEIKKDLKRKTMPKEKKTIPESTGYIA